MPTDKHSAGIAIVAGLIALLAYMSPAMVADYRKHPQRNAIYVLTILGGWTVLGWIGAWVWAFTNTPPNKNGATPQDGADISQKGV